MSPRRRAWKRYLTRRYESSALPARLVFDPSLFSGDNGRTNNSHTADGSPAPSHPAVFHRARYSSRFRTREWKEVDGEAAEAADIEKSRRNLGSVHFRINANWCCRELPTHAHPSSRARARARRVHVSAYTYTFHTRTFLSLLVVVRYTEHSVVYKGISFARSRINRRESPRDTRGECRGPTERRCRIIRCRSSFINATAHSYPPRCDAVRAREPRARTTTATFRFLYNGPSYARTRSHITSFARNTGDFRLEPALSLSRLAARDRPRVRRIPRQETHLIAREYRALPTGGIFHCPPGSHCAEGVPCGRRTRTSG